MGLSGSASANGSSFRVHTGQSQPKFCKELNRSYSVRSNLHMSPPLTSVAANPPMILFLPDLPHTLQGCLMCLRGFISTFMYYFLLLLLLTVASLPFHMLPYSTGLCGSQCIGPMCMPFHARVDCTLKLHGSW